MVGCDVPGSEAVMGAVLVEGWEVGSSETVRVDPALLRGLLVELTEVGDAVGLVAEATDWTVTGWPVVGSLEMPSEDDGACVVPVEETEPDPTGGTVAAVTVSRMSVELGLVGRSSPLVDQIVEGEREVVSLRVLELAAVGPSVAPVAKAAVAVWVPWPSLTGVEANAAMGLDGGRVCATACGELCPFGGDEGGGDVTVEAVSVTRETELMVSEPLVVPGPPV